MKTIAKHKRRTKSMKSHVIDTDLNMIWNHGIVIIESHKFALADASKLTAAVRAQRNDFPKLQTGRMNDTVVAEYADYCAKDLRRASAFIAAIRKHDVSSMIANEFKYKYADQPNAFSSWCLYGSQWLMYFLYVSKLMDYLRVAHPNLAEVWEQRVKPLVTNAMKAQSSDNRSKLGDGYTLRIVTYLNSAANQIDEIRNALAKIVEEPSAASQSATSRGESYSLDKSAKESPTGEQSRGEPLPYADLVRLACLPVRVVKARELLTKLRLEPDKWHNVNALGEGKKGNSAKSIKKHLHKLREKRLTEVDLDGSRWRLGEAAFPGKGTTKRTTNH